MKMHLNLATRDIDASVAFYSTLLGAEPAKKLDDYALFITEQPGLELALDFDAEAKAAVGPAIRKTVVRKPTSSTDTEDRDHDDTSCCRADAAVAAGATCCP